MPGTAINAIDYSNEDDTSSLIEEALGQAAPAQQRAPAQQEYQAPPPQQYQQAPQFQQGPPPQQYQQGPPQFQQGPPQYQQQGPPQYQEDFSQPQMSMPGFTIPDSLKKTLMLFVILLLLNNSSFKNVLSKIPFTITEDGDHTFLMTLVVCVIIALVYFLASQVL